MDSPARCDALLGQADGRWDLDVADDSVHHELPLKHQVPGRLARHGLRCQQLVHTKLNGREAFHLQEVSAHVGIALSVPARESAPPDFELIKPWIASVLEILVAQPELKLVNVNFPAGAPRGILWTRQSVRHYDGKVVTGKDPMGRTHYWFTVVPVEGTDTDTDRWAFERGYVSMTPLRLDLTDEAQLAQAKRLVSLKKISFG